MVGDIRNMGGHDNEIASGLLHRLDDSVVKIGCRVVTDHSLRMRLNVVGLSLLSRETGELLTELSRVMAQRPGRRCSYANVSYRRLVEFRQVSRRIQGMRQLVGMCKIYGHHNFLKQLDLPDHPSTGLFFFLPVRFLNQTAAQDSQVLRRKR